MSRPAAQWWVRADNRAYGPYPSERLPAFVREGRLTPETSVANDPSGPWWPAGRNPSLGELFAPPAVELHAGGAAAPPGPSAAARPPTRSPSMHEAVAPQPEAPEAATPPSPQTEQPQSGAGAQAFLVFAELLAGREARFAAGLAQLGTAARARPGVWLLRGGGDAAAVRNALSQALGEGESLVVVRAEPTEAAWFNLGGEADRALRTLWAQPTGRSSRA